MDDYGNPCLIDPACYNGHREVDLAMIMGTGFPPFTGGLLRFADQLGAETVVARLRELADRVGPRFEPAPILVELAEKDKSFYEVFGG